MMSVNDEILMVYADGELDGPQRASIDAAMASDPALRARVAAIQAQRARVAAAFVGTLDEPVPGRLTRLLQDEAAAPPAQPAPQAGAQVLAFPAARQQRDRRLPTWAQWGGMAASVLLGVLIGAWFDSGGADVAVAPRQEQRLLAGSAIEKALSTQLASEPVTAGVSVQLSFVDRDGNYCRSFSAASVAGLACRQDGQWVVQALAAAPPAAPGPMRQAASPLPGALLEAVDQRIVGQTLDAAGERQARDRQWRR